MLETLVSSRTRLKLLLRLFLNPESSAYLRGMAEEFEESTNSVRIELNRFEETGMIISETKGNKKIYKPNENHPLFRDIQSLLLKHLGIHQIIEDIIKKLGELDEVYLTGDYAKGKDSGVIDLILIGNINTEYLIRLIEKSEPLIKRKIRYIAYSNEEWRGRNKNIQLHSNLLLWSKN